MSYWTQADIQAVLGNAVLTACYDDTNTGVINTVSLGVVQSLSDAAVDSALAAEYAGPFPITEGFATWAAGTPYQIGNAVVPPGGNGFSYRCVVAGTSSGTQPVWPTTLAQTITDGTCTWICKALVPDMVRAASLAWGRALTYERHPEYVRQHGTRPREEAIRITAQLKMAKGYIPDWLGQAPPANVGGVSVDNGARLYVDSPGGIVNAGDY